MTLFEAAASYLRLAEPWSAAVEAMDEASIFEVSIPNVGSSPPIALSVDELIGDKSTEPFLDALRPRMLAMPWRQNPTYTDESFLSRYAYCELVGPTGLVSHAKVSIGLLYLAPGTFYPPHAHPAEEAYHLLAGSSEWQAGSGVMTPRSPGNLYSRSLR